MSAEEPNPIRNTIAELMKQYADEDVWDRPPSLFYILGQETGNELTIGLLDLQFPDEAWSHPPAQVIRMIAEMAEKYPDENTLTARRPDGWKYLGIGFTGEAWALVADKKNPGEVEAAFEAGANHTIHEHPDRIEARILNAILVNEEALWVQQKRGEQPGEIHSNADDPTALDGAIVDGLRRLNTYLVRKFEGELGMVVTH